MNVETRGHAAAEGLRTATLVDVDSGLARLRRTRRRRDMGRLVAAGAVVAAVVGGTFAAFDRAETAPPVERPELGNGPIVNAGERAFGGEPALPSQRPFPLWQAADAASGSFLFVTEAGSQIVDESGTVARITCSGLPCDFGPYPGEVAFGPRDDELTYASPRGFNQTPTSLVIVGYDGEVREQIAVPEEALSGAEFKLMAWSPDRRRLAVAMDSPDSGPDEVWVLGRDGTGARLIHRAEAPAARVEGRFVNETVLVDLAWSPDGNRLGILVAHGLQREEGQPATPSHPLPRLIAVPVTGAGEAETLHTFEFRNPHSTVPGSFIREWAFAWSPDSQRIAVTHEGGIAEISAADGTVLVQHTGYDDYGPLVWLPE